MTLATPEVSVAVLVGVVLLGVVPLEVFPLVSTEPVAVLPVEPLTEDEHEAAPSVTPELVE